MRPWHWQPATTVCGYVQNANPPVCPLGQPVAHHCRYSSCRERLLQDCRLLYQCVIAPGENVALHNAEPTRSLRHTHHIDTCYAIRSMRGIRVVTELGQRCNSDLLHQTTLADVSDRPQNLNSKGVRLLAISFVTVAKFYLFGCVPHQGCVSRIWDRSAQSGQAV